MNILAAKAPAQHWHAPAWATMQNAEMAAAGLVILLLVVAVLRLSKGHKPPAPPPVPKSSGVNVKALLAVVGAGIGGWLLLKPGHGTAVKAIPAPAPTPTPTVTVTAPPKTAPPHFAMPDISLPHLTGTQWTVIVVVALFVTFAIIFPLLRRSS